jgi:hypothetical protein
MRHTPSITPEHLWLKTLLGSAFDDDISLLAHLIFELRRYFTPYRRFILPSAYRR